MKIVIVTGSLLIVQVIAIFLYISPANEVNAATTLFIFWLWWTGLFGVSLSKVLMFDTVIYCEMRGINIC
jgi:pheromone shutdown protein TraB